MSPRIEQRYRFIEKIGEGSQATVDRYLRITKEERKDGKKVVSYAIKKYALPSNDPAMMGMINTTDKEVVLGEIRYLRELQ